MGGGVHCQGGASPTFENVVFLENVAQGGGGFSCIGGSPTFVGCRFIGNGTLEFDGGGALCTDGASPAFIDCFFLDNTSAVGGAGLTAYSSQVSLNGCTLAGNTSTPYAGGGAIYCGWGSTIDATGCTLVGNASPDGAGVLCYPDGVLLMERCLIAFSPQGQAIALYGTSTASLACCDLFGNAGGDWVGPIEDQLGVGGNIAADPLLCDAPQNDFHLQPGSPCAPFSPPNASCDRIGAWPVGCGSMDVSDAPTAAASFATTPAIVSARRAPTAITFTVTPFEARGDVRVSVHDVSGRCIRVLHAGPAAAGTHRLSWSGTDQAGRAVAASVYYVRMETNAGHRARPVLVVQ